MTTAGSGIVFTNDHIRRVAWLSAQFALIAHRLNRGGNGDTADEQLQLLRDIGLYGEDTTADQSARDQDLTASEGSFQALVRLRIDRRLAGQVDIGRKAIASKIATATRTTTELPLEEKKDVHTDDNANADAGTSFDKDDEKRVKRAVVEAEETQDDIEPTVAEQQSDAAGDVSENSDDEPEPDDEKLRDDAPVAGTFATAFPSTSLVQPSGWDQWRSRIQKPGVHVDLTKAPLKPLMPFVDATGIGRHGFEQCILLLVANAPVMRDVLTWFALESRKPPASKSSLSSKLVMMAYYMQDTSDGGAIDATPFMQFAAADEKYGSCKITTPSEFLHAVLDILDQDIAQQKPVIGEYKGGDYPSRIPLAQDGTGPRLNEFAAAHTITPSYFEYTMKHVRTSESEAPTMHSWLRPVAYDVAAQTHVDMHLLAYHSLEGPDAMVNVLFISILHGTDKVMLRERPKCEYFARLGEAEPPGHAALKVTDVFSGPRFGMGPPALFVTFDRSALVTREKQAIDRRVDAPVLISGSELPFASTPRWNYRLCGVVYAVDEHKREYACVMRRPLVVERKGTYSFKEPDAKATWFRYTAGDVRVLVDDDRDASGLKAFLADKTVQAGIAVLLYERFSVFTEDSKAGSRKIEQEWKQVAADAAPQAVATTTATPAVASDAQTAAAATAAADATPRRWFSWWFRSK